MKKRILKKNISLSGFIFLLSILTTMSMVAQPSWAATCGSKPETSFSSIAASISQPTDCIRFLNDFIPLTTDSVIEIRVKMYVFSPSSGIGTWDNATTARAQNAIRFVDSTYAHFSVNQATLWPANPAPIANSRLKFVLVGNLNKIVADSTYTSVQTVENTTTYNDPTVINIYYGAAFNVACSFCVPSYFDKSFVNTPYPNNHVYFAHGHPGSNVQLDLGDGFYAYTLAHELGHALGLQHTEYDTASAFNGFSTISSQFGCCQLIGANDYQQDTTKGWYACNDPLYSNNLMTTANGCMHYLSPQQMAVMHHNIRTVFKGMLTTKGFNDATTVNHSSDYSVTSNETWTSDRYFKGNILVKANKTLTIKCLVAMTKNANITVESGGQLIIDGGNVTNISGTTWDGIYLMGNPFQAQLTFNSANSGAVLYQGMLRIKNSGTISQANIGVRNYHNNSGGGGIIFAQNANFINNVRDVDMVDPHTANSLPIPSISWFYNCNFKTTDTIANGLTPTEHVYLRRVSGVKFMACVFKCDLTGLYPGHGISSVDANYIVDQNASVSTVFQNLDKGIYVNNTNPLKIPAISNTSFIDNYTSAYFMNANYLSFQTNTLQSRAYEGVYLNNCKYYKIKNNIFSGPSSSPADYVGIGVYRSKTGTHEIYRNTFSNLNMGINCMDDNGNPNPSILNDGLKMNCNIFTVTPNNYDVVLSYTSGLALPKVLINQGEISSGANQFNLVRNVYGASCGNQNKWQIYSGSTVTINHGSNTNTLTAVTQPTATGCKSGYLNVVDKNIGLVYSTDCLLSPPSSGGTSTLSSNRLGAMNDYIGDLKEDEMNTGNSQHFEVQSTVASKINLFLTDTVEGSIDSVITLLESNPGDMEDADIQTVFAYMSKGDYTTAQDKVNNLTGRDDWAALLNGLIFLEQDTSGRIDSLHSDDIDFLRDYADTDNKDGQSIAQALLFYGAGIDYSEPHALPEESTGARLMSSQTNENSKLNDLGSFISIYPNPTQTGVNIYYSSKEDGKVKIELKDLVGRVIYTNFINERTATQYIQMNQLSSGMYLITLTKGKEVIHKEKLIKE